MNANPFGNSAHIIGSNEFTDISALSTLSGDAFDGIFNQSNNSFDIPNPFMSSKQSFSPPMTESNGIGFVPKINPFAVSNGVTMETNGHGKYDAFRSSTLEMNRVDNVEESGDVKPVDLNLFKDAAAAAFSEFGKSKHETNAKIDNAVNGKVMSSASDVLFNKKKTFFFAFLISK